MLTHLVADLRRMHEGSAWHGPAVLEVLDGVSATQAASRPVPGAHSIYELTHHIAAWIGEVRARLEGNPPGAPADGDFPDPACVVDDTAWQDVRARLERRQSELMETLSAFDADRLDDPVDPKRRPEPGGPGSFRALLSGLAQHNAYHAGQIMILRRALQRSGA